MILRLTDRARKVYHIPRLLYYWRSHEGSVAAGLEAKPYAVDAAKRAVADHLEKHGFRNFQISSTRAFPTIFRIRYQVEGNPRISIIIPNKDHRDDLRRCVDSIMDRSTYDNYELIIVENGSVSRRSETITRSCWGTITEKPWKNVGRGPLGTSLMIRVL